MQTAKWLVLLLAVTFLASAAQAQTLDVDPEDEAQEQVEAFDAPPEREPAAGIEELTVTAQRKSETLQEVPIAVSAFNAEALEMQQISQFTDLQFSAPNVSFSNSNFGGGGNFSIRGIGSAAVATSGSAGVAFHVNEAAIPTFIFQTEFYDLERVEILRGPQGTLYGANATGGVVNVISARPVMEEFEGNLEVDYGNYNSLKVRGAINVPIGDRVAIRLAGLSLQRDGMIENLYDGGEVNSDNIDGRDLYSLRATIAADITDSTYATFYWSRFSENDNRARITKTLCNATDTPQLGCGWRGSIEDQRSDAPFPQAVAGNIFSSYGGLAPWGEIPQDLNWVTPEVQKELNTNRRAMATDMEPIYEAEESVYMLQLTQELPQDLSMHFIGAYVNNSAYSMQDFNNDVGYWFQPNDENPQGVLPVSATERLNWDDANLNGVFGGDIFRWDNRVFGYDKSFGTNNTWYGEARISSDWESSLNFLAGINYRNSMARTGYNVLSNTLEAVAVDATPIGNPNGPVPMGLNAFIPGVGGEEVPVNGLYPSFYFNQTNPYVLNSLGIYGEGYWDITEEIKFTGGIRYSRDNKTIRDRNTLLNSLQFGGAVNEVPQRLCLLDLDPLTPGNQIDYGCLVGNPAPLGPVAKGGTIPCPTADDPDAMCLPNEGLPPYNFGRAIKGSNTEETWNAFTGRAVIDYLTELPFTDETLFYASWSRGYRPGGFNPAVDPSEFAGVQDTFDAEYVNAWEVGMKNKFMDIGLIANLSAFYYDYKGYQISKIQNRTAINENIDADIWGLELETMWAVPYLPGALIDFNFSYLGTQIKNGQASVDPRDPGGERFGNYDSTYLAKDSIFAQPCTLDRQKFKQAYESGILDGTSASQNFYVGGRPDSDPDKKTYSVEEDWPTLVACSNMGAVPVLDSGMTPDLAFGDPGCTSEGGCVNLRVPEYEVDIEGNDMPNSPEITLKIGAQYTFPVEALGFAITPRTDYYWQSSMWGRIYNAPLDEIPAWMRWDAQVLFEDLDGSWFIRGYVKNILNDQNITGFTVLDAAVANFTNIQVIEPRLFGFAVGANF